MRGALSQMTVAQIEEFLLERRNHQHFDYHGGGDTHLGLALNEIRDSTERVDVLTKVVDAVINKWDVLDQGEYNPVEVVATVLLNRNMKFVEGDVRHLYERLLEESRRRPHSTARDFLEAYFR